jgi:hypothetical protein
LPKAIRDALGLLPGTKVDISPYGAGAQIVPTGRTARLVEEDGVLVAAGETPVDDDMVFALVDAGRKWPKRTRFSPGCPATPGWRQPMPHGCSTPGSRRRSC